MRTLLILRHAKSSWAQPGLGDAERPLNKRGQKQLGLLSSWFSRNADGWQVALCSPTERTRQTWQGIEAALPSTSLEHHPSLYDGSVDSYLDALYARDEERVMIVGHNPTCDELVRYLASPNGSAAEKLMAHHFGTANFAVIEFDVEHWTDIGEGKGRLVTYLRPADLDG